MAQTVNVNFKLDADVKKSMEQACADMAASENGLTMDVAKLVLSISRQLADDGCASEGTQALLKHYISEA